MRRGHCGAGFLVSRGGFLPDEPPDNRRARDCMNVGGGGVAGAAG